MISILLMFFAGLCNAIMDVLYFHYYNSIFQDWPNQQWINPALSWRNKWKNGDPDQGEKFLGSSTVFVFLTDFWHFAKFLMLLFITAAIIFYYPLIVWWADFIIVYCIFTITFEVFYRKVLIK